MAKKSEKTAEIENDAVRCTLPVADFEAREARWRATETPPAGAWTIWMLQEWRRAAQNTPYNRGRAVDRLAAGNFINAAEAVVAAEGNRERARTLSEVAEHLAYAFGLDASKHHALPFNDPKVSEAVKLAMAAAKSAA